MNRLVSARTLAVIGLLPMASSDGNEKLPADATPKVPSIELLEFLGETDGLQQLGIDLDVIIDQANTQKDQPVGGTTGLNFDDKRYSR